MQHARGEAFQQVHDESDEQTAVATSSDMPPAPHEPTPLTGEWDLSHNVEPLSKPAKAIFVGLGWICLSIGHALSTIPKVRATLFVIAAHWCFLQSSPKWQGWLYRHPKHGHVLEDWHHHQRVPKNIKVSATLTLLLGAGLIGMSMGRLSLVAFGLFVCMPIACFLWTRPVTPD